MNLSVLFCICYDRLDFWILENFSVHRDFNLVYSSYRYVSHLVLNVSQMPFLLFSRLRELDLSLL